MRPSSDDLDWIDGLTDQEHAGLILLALRRMIDGEAGESLPAAMKSTAVALLDSGILFDHLTLREDGTLLIDAEEKKRFDLVAVHVEESLMIDFLRAANMAAPWVEQRLGGTPFADHFQESLAYVSGHAADAGREVAAS